MRDMSLEHCGIAERLLAEVRASHEALIAHTNAGPAAQGGLNALYRALAAGLAGLAEAQILATPSPDEWSMAEVLEHVAEHDRKYAEFERQGLDHYVEHGLEHALQLWRLRSLPRPSTAGGAGRDGATPDEGGTA